MTLDQLKVLHKIVETGSFRAASEALFRAQSAVSYAIKTLEEELGFEVFDRQGYRPELTEAGKAIHHKAKVVLSHAEDLSCLGEQLAMGEEPEIRLAVNAICPLTPVTKVFRRFAAEHPHAHLRLFIENLGGSMERLLDGDVDMAVTEVYESQKRLQSRRCGQVQFVAVAEPTCVLAQMPSPLSQANLSNQTQIIVGDTSRHSEPKTTGVVETSIPWTVSDFFTKRELLIAGLGWGFMPLHFVRQDLESQRLVQLELEDPLVNRIELFLLRRKDRPVGPLATELWNALESHIQTEFSKF